MANKTKKTGPLWAVPISGVLLSAAVWLIGTLILTGGMALGVVQESGSFPALAAVTVIAALIGGGYVMRGAGFVPALAAAGLLIWSEFGWFGHGGLLLLCAIAGGVCAGLFGNGGKRKKSRRRV